MKSYLSDAFLVKFALPIFNPSMYTRARVHACTWKDSNNISFPENAPNTCAVFQTHDLPVQHCIFLKAILSSFMLHALLWCRNTMLHSMSLTYPSLGSLSTLFLSSNHTRRHFIKVGSHTYFSVTPLTFCSSGNTPRGFWVGSDLYFQSDN